MKLNTLHDLYVHQLQDLYSAEQQILDALPKMIDAAQHEQLKTAFQEHLQQTRQQLERLEQVGRNLGTGLDGHTCKAMKGIVSEGEEMIKQRASDDVRDAGLITSAQRVEHYEIAGYGTVCTYAEMLGRNDDLPLLQQTLAEEKNTDEKLNELAKQVVNVDALHA